MSDIEIKPWRPSVLTATNSVYLYELLVHLSPDNDVEGGMSEMKKRLRKTFRSENKMNLMLVAKEKGRGGKIIGTGSFHSIPAATRWDFWLKDFIVRRECRQKGLATRIGNMLLEHAQGVSDQLDRPIMVRSRCTPKQMAAMKFFEKLGFEVISPFLRHRNGKVVQESEATLRIEFRPEKEKEEEAKAA